MTAAQDTGPATPFQAPAELGSILRIERLAERGVLRFAIDNPPLNVLTQRVRHELGTLLLGLHAPATSENVAVRAAVFASGPCAFCAGADPNEFEQRFHLAVARLHALNAHRMILALVESDTPVIAALRGACMGGGLELALGCAYRIAGASATLALPEVQRGIWPGTGGSVLLARQVGPSIAKRLLYTGETLEAKQALEIGLVDEVVEDAEVDARSLALAGEIADRPAGSVRTLSQLVDHEFRRQFRSHLQFEIERFVQAYQTDDAREGLAAFFEKRLTKWVHR